MSIYTEIQTPQKRLLTPAERSARVAAQWTPERREKQRQRFLNRSLNPTVGRPKGTQEQ